MLIMTSARGNVRQLPLGGRPEQGSPYAPWLATSVTPDQWDAVNRLDPAAVGAAVQEQANVLAWQVRSTHPRTNYDLRVLVQRTAAENEQPLTGAPAAHRLALLAKDTPHDESAAIESVLTRAARSIAEAERLRQLDETEEQRPANPVLEAKIATAALDVAFLAGRKVNYVARHAAISVLKAGVSRSSLGRPRQ